MSLLCLLKWMVNWMCNCSSLRNAAFNIISYGLIWKNKVNLLSIFLPVENTIYFEYKKILFPHILVCISLVSLIYNINSFLNFFANVFNSSLQNWVILTRVYSHTAHFWAILWWTRPARVKEHSFLLGLGIMHYRNPPCFRCRFPLKDSVLLTYDVKSQLFVNDVLCAAGTRGQYLTSFSCVLQSANSPYRLSTCVA